MIALYLRTIRAEVSKVRRDVDAVNTRVDEMEEALPNTVSEAVAPLHAKIDAMTESLKELARLVSNREAADHGAAKARAPPAKKDPTNSAKGTKGSSTNMKTNTKTRAVAKKSPATRRTTPPKQAGPVDKQQQPDRQDEHVQDAAQQAENYDNNNDDAAPGKRNRDPLSDSIQDDDDEEEEDELELFDSDSQPAPAQPMTWLPSNPKAQTGKLTLFNGCLTRPPDDTVTIGPEVSFGRATILEKDGKRGALVTKLTGTAYLLGTHGKCVAFATTTDLTESGWEPVGRLKVKNVRDAYPVYSATCLLAVSKHVLRQQHKNHAVSKACAVLDSPAGMYAISDTLMQGPATMTLLSLQ